MKILLNGLIFIFSSAVAFGQTIQVTGVVDNQKGQPVPYAFVRDAQHNYATFADSAGSFSLKADPSSSLRIAANGFQENTLKIDNRANIDVTLSAGQSEGTVVSMKALKQTVDAEFLHAQGLLFGGDASQQQVKSGFVQEPTKGSRYLFSDWVPGFGINKNDSLVAELSYLYNYDKISGNIMYTNDGRSMSAVSNSQIKSFNLFDKFGNKHVYEQAPAIGDEAFVEVLLNTPKYKIYKKIETKLVRADFHTDGVVEVGHRYDEYVDNEHYYFVGADGKKKSISLRKNTLKKLMGGDADAFIASQGSRDVDEEYVKDLGASLAK
ncbi:MAG TPA: carboxypeptidase-like regulatory domain-containing protein [Mucilaginibacter sp.]|nr:carboxypeptidase-like regulatory domain-containing protein [Mucilaginibacter sp.]